MANNINLKTDRNIWIALILCLSAVAFFLLWREGHKQFGTIAYGVFPEFSAVDSQGQGFNHHALKANLSVVVMGFNERPVIDYLRHLAMVTAQGKRYLKVLVFGKPEDLGEDKFVRYLQLPVADDERLTGWQSRFQKGVILVDQDKVVRGVFNINDKAERLKFEAAVGGIL